MTNTKNGIFEIKTSNLLLDQSNPRLYGESITDSQKQIIKTIYDKEQIDELASSLAINGYFKEEPIIVIPENEVDFDNISTDNVNEFKYIVIEGNRRTTSVKLLLDDTYKIVDEDFPKIIKSEIRESLHNLPAIIYRKREDVDIYLSIRHISGNRKWDAYAKAKYIFEKVNKINIATKDILQSINILSSQIGDQSNIIKKNYIYYKVFKTIEEDVIDYSSKHIKKRFSLLEVALGSGNTPITKYIGLPAFRNINLDDDVIPSDKLGELTNITNWIFGNDDQGNDSLISDSRNINGQLKPILQNEEATNHLKEFRDIEGAYELTGGEEKFVIGNVKKSTKSLSNILAKIPKYKDNEDFVFAFKELEGVMKSFNVLLKNSEL